jgi:hypothetical protein
MSDTENLNESADSGLIQPRLVRQDRPWRDYPLGTMAHSCTGGHWLKKERGWKWNGPDGNGLFSLRTSV